ncbi:MAG: hypothetical protein JW902_10005 [Syntrophaceae bacterium]|nr:hypothetical protein [Syntrophaceae bacterium]
MSEKTYQIEVSWDEEILEIIIIGRASKENAGEIAQEVFRIAGENKPKRMLIDCRNVQGRLSIGDTYYHVRGYPNVRIKAAVLDILENKSYYSFHEAAAKNLGFPIKYFNHVDGAKAWLQQ